MKDREIEFEDRISDIQGFSAWGYEIPDYMAGGLARYIVYGVMPGDFLSAVLRGDLFAALSSADENNMRCLPAYGYYLYNHAPSNCFGSTEKVSAYVDATYKLECES